MPSPLNSPTATDPGSYCTSKLVARLKLPSPSPRNTDMLYENLCDTTKSEMPSPLKSATATLLEPSPTPKLVA